jgi:hypothetical protein
MIHHSVKVAFCLVICVFAIGCNNLPPIPTPSFFEELEPSPPPEKIQERLPTQDLIAWLENARKANADSEKVFSELQAAGWLSNEDDWLELDMNGDGNKEWLITIYLYPHDLSWGRPGDFIVIGAEGILFHFFSPEDYFCVTQCQSDYGFWQSAPHVIATGDMTGDNLSEVVLIRTAGGAHTIVQTYFVLSNHFGTIEDLVSLPTNRYEWGDSIYYEGGAKSIVLTYSDFQGLKDVDGDGLADLLIHGGWHGSAGSGIQRTRTETWGWNGEAITISEIAWDPTEYRMHLLWEANDNYYINNYADARSLFLQVIQDETLKESPYGSAEYQYNSIRRFAAFRLLLISLLENDIDEANSWKVWLENNYPETAISYAAAMMLSEIATVGEISAACEKVTKYLVQYNDQTSTVIDRINPTGSLIDMGYANPSLYAEDVCLIIR